MNPPRSRIALQLAAMLALVLVGLWLALDRRFVQQLWVEMSLAGAMERGSQRS